MIHHNRINRPIIQDTYGLVTDGLKWTFIQVCKEHEVCYSDQVEIEANMLSTIVFFLDTELAGG